MTSRPGSMTGEAVVAGAPLRASGLLDNPGFRADTLPVELDDCLII
jgi:hypothetical protein